MPPRMGVTLHNLGKLADLVSYELSGLLDLFCSWHGGMNRIITKIGYNLISLFK